MTMATMMEPMTEEEWDLRRCELRAAADMLDHNPEASAASSGRSIAEVEFEAATMRAAADILDVTRPS